MNTDAFWGLSEGVDIWSTPDLTTCGKCKSKELTKQCFSPECDKIRCASCVTNLCKKNSTDELKDDDGELIYVCTKVS